MNPILVGAGVKALESVDFKKVMTAIGGLLVVVAVVIIVKKYKKKTEKEASDEAFLKTLQGNIVTNDLSYEVAWYEAQAIGLATALDAPFGSNGGFYGCDQNAVYDIMKQLKTKADAEQLELTFGRRELNASWLSKKESMTLREAILKLMTSKERRKVNKILSDKGIEYSF